MYFNKYRTYALYIIIRIISLLLIVVLIEACSGTNKTPVSPGDGGGDNNHPHQDIDSTVFKKINLDYPGLEEVKSYVQQSDYRKAAKSLLKYFQDRNSPKLPKYNQSDQFKWVGKTLDKGVQEKADSALKHIFFVHKGYGYNGDGFLHYGKNIQWVRWLPGVEHDNQLLTQLNRTYWWIPMGKAYWSTGNEKYAKEWIAEYKDWVKKNPLHGSKRIDKYAWVTLSVSRRLQDQAALFNFFLGSPHFTPAFLLTFLDNYYTQEKYLQQNYSKRGNHLLFEAQRIIWATTFFPELKHSKEWRREAINILKSQMDVQVYPDGVQYELSPNYHVAVINIFWRAANMMRLNGLKSKLGNSYFNTMKKMIMALVNFSFPDYTYPMFGDAKLITKRVIKRDYNRWLKVFPNNGVIRYYATDGGAGHPPTYLSKGLTSGGFYTFRNGWDKHSTVMVLKASPPGFFHNQPDNSTFVLWINGRRYTPDSGSYIYGGGSKVEKQRNWFRATRHHQTLTLDDKNIKIDKAHLIKWQTGDTLDVLSYKNPSYNNLTHQRTVFFVDHKFFVFVDEAKGNATGKINLHFQLAENSHPTVKKQQNKVYTSYTKGKNLAIQSFSSHPMQYVKEEGRVSYSYKEYKERPAFSFQQAKNDGKQVNYITILYPYKGNNPPQMQAKFSEDNNFSNNQFSLAVTINGEKYFIHQNMDD